MLLQFENELVKLLGQGYCVDKGYFSTDDQCVVLRVVTSANVLDVEMHISEFVDWLQNATGVKGCAFKVVTETVINHIFETEHHFIELLNTLEKHCGDCYDLGVKNDLDNFSSLKGKLTSFLGEYNNCVRVYGDTITAMVVKQNQENNW